MSAILPGSSSLDRMNIACVLLQDWAATGRVDMPGKNTTCYFVGPYRTSYNPLKARLIGHSSHADGVPLFALTVTIRLANSTTSVYGQGPQPAVNTTDVLTVGEATGSVYLPSAQKRVYVQGFYAARLVVNADHEETGLMGQVHLNYYGENSVSNILANAAAAAATLQGNFTASVGLPTSNASWTATGGLQPYPRVLPGISNRYFTVAAPSAWLHSSSPTPMASFVNQTSRLLDMGDHQVPIKAWFTSQLWNGSATFLGEYKVEYAESGSMYIYGSIRAVGWLLSKNSSGATMQAAVSGYGYASTELFLVNGSIPVSGEFQGSAFASAELSTDETQRCSACSHCISSFALGMRGSLQEKYATIVAEAFSALCAANQHNLTLCNQVQDSIAASKHGNIGKC